MAVKYFKTKDGEILTSKCDVYSKKLKTRYTEVTKDGKAKAKKKTVKKKYVNVENSLNPMIIV